MSKFVKLLFSTRINNMDKIILFILATLLLLISTSWLRINIFTMIWGIMIPVTFFYLIIRVFCIEFVKFHEALNTSKL
ncbi:hypothetical protein BTG_31383 (plasmid) [Bacillus thuringiensis HD-771]|uniref:Uncharacterized protein n=1 Tax=Bacillus thuringiensis HD-771 TaxID=1218175 RepID=A0A9W3JJC3_BACTU|nr:hypothetical protein BTG_31383 [Bacillus thuringiensis HD-771]